MLPRFGPRGCCKEARLHRPKILGCTDSAATRRLGFHLIQLPAAPPIIVMVHPVEGFEEVHRGYIQLNSSTAPMYPFIISIRCFARRLSSTSALRLLQMAVCKDVPWDITDQAPHDFRYYRWLRNRTKILRCRPTARLEDRREHVGLLFL